jgi:hypothetical protein
MTRFAILIVGVGAAAPAAARADTVDELPCCTVADGHTPCAEDKNDVVGYRRCTTYGMWGASLLEPYMFIDLGANLRHFGASQRPQPVARASTPGTTDSSSSGGSRALMFDERVGVQLGHGLFLAFDFEFGDMAASQNPGPNERVFAVDGLVSLGLRGSTGPLSLQAEVAGGAMQSSYANQPELMTDPMLEGRGRVDWWLTPWLTIGGAAGASFIQRGDWMVGLYVGFHTWSYAGDHAQ